MKFKSEKTSSNTTEFNQHFQ